MLCCPCAASVAARAVASPGHLPAVDGAVAIGLVAVQPLQAVIQDNVTEELVAKKGSSVIFLEPLLATCSSGRFF